MGVLSNELSSWRKNIVECTSHNVTTLNFRDTRPNVMLVMNPTEREILCNLDSIPTENHYDFRIKNHYARLVGKPVATSQVYFLNNSEEDITLQVYSIYDKNFDPSWLSDFSIENVNIGAESIEPIITAIAKNNKIDINGVTPTDSGKLPVHDDTIATYLSSIIGSLNFEDESSFAGTLMAVNPSPNVVTLASIRSVLATILNLTEEDVIGEISNIGNSLDILMKNTSTTGKNTFANVLSKMDVMISSLTELLKPGVSSEIRNIASLSTRLEQITGTISPSNNGNSLKDIFNAINEGCAIKGTSFGSVLLNNEEPVEGFLGIYNIIQSLNTIATKLDTVATKLDTLIAK